MGEPASVYLLDTCVLSEFCLRTPHPAFVHWISHIPDTAIAICPSNVLEIQQGIERLRLIDADRAVALEGWLIGLLQSSVVYLTLTPSGARLLARMKAVPALNQLWLPRHKTKPPKVSEDLAIAAVSIDWQVPVVTTNTRDFLSVHRYFELPGLYDPLTDHWLVEPVAKAWVPPGIVLAEHLWLHLTSVSGSRSPT